MPELWDAYQGFPEFAGERWSLHDKARSPKIAVADKYGLRLVASRMGAGFSLDPAYIHEGSHGRFQQISNSGYQASRTGHPDGWQSDRAGRLRYAR